ncbi:MAG: spore coat protein CotJB [Bacilli bacterium]|nr:spore coat protein CotJB [Bacilli bacterium]
MNNYSDMNSYMPEDFEYLNRLYNFGMPNNMQKQEQMNPMMQNNQMMPNQNNMNTDMKLKQKLAMQAGDNMMFNKPNYNQQANPNEVYDVYGGFIRGNMFPDLYNTYKNSKPFEIRPMNEQAEMLTYLDAYGFAAHDLNLYLDNNPNDRDMIRLFAEYTNKANQIQKEYEQKYGPLFVDASTTYPWAWNDSPWPWENK